MEADTTDPDVKKAIESLHELCETGVSDCPWASWDECFSFDIEQIVGIRLQTLCQYRRMMNQYND